MSVSGGAPAAAGAALQPGRALTRGLSSALVGAPVMAAATDEEAASTADGEPLRRQSTTQMNRSRVQENQRLLAAQLLMYSLPVMGCTFILLVALFIATLVIYIQGWMVMSNFGSKPCDQPLKWWLLAMLLVPILQCQLNCQTQPDQRPKRLQAMVMPVVLVIGVWMCSECRTCPKTNPELFQYAKMYLIYQSVVWALMVFMSCGLVSLVFWMHRNGLLEAGPGPGSAARPGLVQDLETVNYTRELFSDCQEDDPQPPECSICQEEFVEQEEIKKTPCAHFFHESCLQEWLENYAKSCPLCREDLEAAVEQRGA